MLKPNLDWRILFLLHCAPRPDAPHGGGRVISQLLAALAARHRVGVVYLRDVGEPALDEALRSQCEVVEEVRWVDGPRSLLRRVRHRLGIVGSLMAGTPGWVAHLPIERFSARVRRLVAAWAPDLVQLEFSVMGHALPALDGCPAPRVLTHYMPGRDAAPSAGGAMLWPAAALHRYLELRAWRRFERGVFRSVDVIATLTERDRQAVIEEQADAVICTVPVSVPIPPRPLNPIGVDPPTVLCVGNYHHPPNLDAAERLAHRIMPIVHRRCPDAVLTLVGDASSAALRRLAGASVALAGRVPDVMPYLDRAAVVAAPMRRGGGVHVKVLEALAAGKPTVASPLALEGLDVAPGDQVLLAETDEEFAAAIIALIDSPNLRGELGRSARAWACANLGPERLVRAYEAVYQRLLSR